MKLANSSRKSNVTASARRVRNRKWFRQQIGLFLVFKYCQWGHWAEHSWWLMEQVNVIHQFVVWQESTSPSVQAHVSYIFQEQFPDLCCQQHLELWGSLAIAFSEKLLLLPGHSRGRKELQVEERAGTLESTGWMYVLCDLGKTPNLFKFHFLHLSNRDMGFPLKNEWVNVACLVPGA